MCKHHNANPPIYPDKALFFTDKGKYWAYIKGHPANNHHDRYMYKARYLAWEKRDKVHACEKCGKPIDWEAKEFYGILENGEALVYCRVCHSSRSANITNGKRRCERTYERTLRYREEMRIKHIEMIHWWRTIHVSRLGKKRTGELRTRAD